MIRIALVLIAAALSLTGCGDSGLPLDRTVDVGGMTLSVPSVWIEDGDESDLFDDENIGYRLYYPQDEDAIDLIYVGYSSDDEYSGFGDPDEYIEESYDGAGSLVDERVIDGFSVRTYEIEDAGYPLYVSTFRGYDMNYNMQVNGSEVDVYNVLDTVEIE